MSEEDAFDMDTAGVLLDEPTTVVEAPPFETPMESVRRLTGIPADKPKGTAGYTYSNPRIAEPLYFDLETIPDYSRLHLFGLEELPPIPEESTGQMPDIETTISGTVDSVKAVLKKIVGVPPSAWLDQLSDAELLTKKPRSGVFDAINDARNIRKSVEALHDERRKLLSTTPEYCSICAMGWVEGNGTVCSLVVGDDTNEVHILQHFWRLAARTKPAIAFNGLGFDLPVIFVRSAILGVPATRRFDLKPWGNDVVDPYAIRFPRGAGQGRPGRLKALAAVHGIEVPAGDCDGSQVEALWKSDPAKVGEYVRSDVEVLRAYHQALAGYFWT